MLSRTHFVLYMLFRTHFVHNIIFFSAPMLSRTQVCTLFIVWVHDGLLLSRPLGLPRSETSSPAAPRGCFLHFYEVSHSTHTVFIFLKPTNLWQKKRNFSIQHLVYYFACYFCFHYLLKKENI